MKKILMCTVFIGLVMGGLFACDPLSSLFRQGTEIEKGWKKVHVGYSCSLIVPKEFVSQTDHYRKAVETNNSAEILNAAGFRVLEKEEMDYAKMWIDNSDSKFPHDSFRVDQILNPAVIIMVGVIPAEVKRENETLSQILEQELSNYIKLQTQESLKIEKEDNRTERYLIPYIRTINGKKIIHGGTLTIYSDETGSSSRVTDIFLIPGKTKMLCIQITYYPAPDNPWVSKVERIINSIDVSGFYNAEYGNNEN